MATGPTKYAVSVQQDGSVSLPTSLMEAVGAHPGKHFVVILSAHGRGLQLVEHPTSLRGTLPGIDTTVVREPDREL